MGEACEPRLVLRLLPWSGAGQDHVLRLLQRNRLGASTAKEASDGAFLCDRIEESTPAHYGEAVVRCWLTPYRQRWASSLVDGIFMAILTICKDNEKNILVEMFHFDDAQSEECRLLRCAAESGLLRLCAKLQESTRREARWSWLADSAPRLRPADLHGRDFFLMLTAVRIGDPLPANRRSRPPPSGMQELLAAATDHWSDVERHLPAADGGCRTVVLADTLLVAQHQRAWARNQKALRVEACGSVREEALLRPGERLLLLPLVGALPDLTELETQAEPEARFTDWSPWRACLRERAEAAVGRGRDSQPFAQLEAVLLHTRTARAAPAPR